MFVLSSHCLPMFLTHKKSHKRRDIYDRGGHSVMLLSRMFGQSLVKIVIYGWPMSSAVPNTQYLLASSIKCRPFSAKNKLLLHEYFAPYEYFDFSSVLWWPSHLNLIYCVFSIMAQARSNLCHRWEFSNWWALSAKIQWATNFSISLTLDIFHWLPRILLHSGENGKDREATYIYVL